MKNVSLLFSVIFCFLLSINLFAQNCLPLTLDIDIHYNRDLQELSDSLCVTVFWEFDNNVVCEQFYKKKDEVSTDDPIPVEGTISVPFRLPVGEPCPPAPPCKTKENVKSITVIVTDCKNPPDFSVDKKVEDYKDKIDINYW